MRPQQVLVRFGDLTLKGRNRRRFENTVLRQIRQALKGKGQFLFHAEFGRVIIELLEANYTDVAASLKTVFGIVSFSPIYKEPLELAAIQAAGFELMEQLAFVPHTFKVETRRINKQFPYDTLEMNRLVGGYVLQRMEGLRVDVRRPEITLHLEIREDCALLYNQVEAGAGGFPLGTNGKGLLLLSGGIDSPVAGYLALRQGLALEAVHFHSYPYTSERAQQKVIDLARRLELYAGPMRLHMVPLTELQTKLKQQYNGNLYVTLLRRAMLSIAEKLAERQGAGALVTGESLGQVASQTLPSMNVISRVVKMPIIRPLVCMEKQEIIGLGERIGTYPISILPYEDCCTLFLPPNPSTNPNLSVVERIENKLSWLKEAIEEAANRTETVIAGEGKDFEQRLSDFF